MTSNSDNAAGRQASTGGSRRQRGERRRTAAEVASDSSSGGRNHVASGVGPQQKTDPWRATSSHDRRSPRRPKSIRGDSEHVVSDDGRQQQAYRRRSAAVETTWRATSDRGRRQIRGGRRSFSTTRPGSGSVVDGRQTD